MALETRIQVRLSEIEKENLQEQANEAGFTISDYIRWLVINNSGKEE